VYGPPSLDNVPALRRARGLGFKVIFEIVEDDDVALGVSGILASLLLGLALKHRTNDVLPFVDAAVTVFSLVAQWMATRKWLENWLLWMVLNVSNIAICLSQGLYPMSGLYAFFLVLAVFGFREWSRSLRARGGGAPVAAA
jgi:nicotinamide mononucleotide transporter